MENSEEVIKPRPSNEMSPDFVEKTFSSHLQQINDSLEGVAEVKVDTKQLNISNLINNVPIKKETYMKMRKKKKKSDRGGSVDMKQTIIPGCLKCYSLHSSATLFHVPSGYPPKSTASTLSYTITRYSLHNKPSFLLGAHLNQSFLLISTSLSFSCIPSSSPTC